ncbi:hypothetical protein PUNSTDRAFT_144398 [Punctularia strigosozonata HHB-11173 SS5]|uniref:uncharacterized protein n=1 Tax=Punctularia strigosozonata (strain HHB-11173) TaxID=741275 RepID=UPI0004417A95|nr:uncharacterized protein PUNSTDRAFT_144398 [Punctularia strigosozonata HHB-11173 SS5]EIN07907.1 hypothetical protein PUNSTDRAFT_144398 [Punctularia strigosozonata HHB-11173 SS5]
MGSIARPPPTIQSRHAGERLVCSTGWLRIASRWFSHLSGAAYCPRSGGLPGDAFGGVREYKAMSGKRINQAIVLVSFAVLFSTR